MTDALSMTLPGTDLVVSRICLGGNRLGGELDQKDSFALLDAFVERGGTFVDSAHVYANWIAGNERNSSEKTLGRWLKARGGARGVVIATKGGSPEPDTPRVRRLDELSIRQDVSEALDNLGVGSLDLFYLHRDDTDRPVEELLGVVEAMRAEGLIRHYACSNWSGIRMEEAADVARRNGWTGFVASQSEWSLATRNAGTSSDDLLQMNDAMMQAHKRLNLPAIPYSSQARGYFDKVDAGTLDAVTAARYDNGANRKKAAVLAAVARRHGATPTQVMLAAMMRSPFPTIPIVGCRTPDQVAGSLAACTVRLDDADVAAIAAT
jgi:aryl-alcohol dehydrogenase-like predicted oxidoreductase